MAGIGGFDTTGSMGRFNNGLGVVSETMGFRPDERADISRFSRLLEQAEGRERQEPAESSAPVTDGSKTAAPAAALPGRIVPRQVHIDKTDKLYEQCLELETFLVKNILNAMRKTVNKSDLINTGFAGEFYEDMLWDEYSKEYTKNAGFGLADLAYLELTGQRGRKP
jgi:peptidoglycan hydrolase FlgJ